MALLQSERMIAMHSLQGLPSRISGSVGTPGKARNDSDDVRSIQNLFNLITPKTTSPLLVDGKCGPLLVQRIKDYQSSRLKVATPDGVIDPAGRTFSTLLEDARKAIPVTPANDSAGAAAAPTPPRPPAPAPAPADTLQLVTKASCDGRVTLTDADFQSAATALGSGISVNIIKAFATVESGGRSGFGPAQMPVIAYEGHIFRKYTQQKYDKAYPLLSYAYREKPARNGKPTTKPRRWRGRPWPMRSS